MSSIDDYLFVSPVVQKYISFLRILYYLEWYWNVTTFRYNSHITRIVKYSQSNLKVDKYIGKKREIEIYQIV